MKTQKYKQKIINKAFRFENEDGTFKKPSIFTDDLFKILETEQLKQCDIHVVISRFNIKQEDIYKINGIIRKHIEDSCSGFYANSEDEKNHIRRTLYDVVSIALNGL